MKEFQSEDNQLKQQIKNLIYKYSTTAGINKIEGRYITNDNLQLFFKELLVLIGWRQKYQWK